MISVPVDKTDIFTINIGGVLIFIWDFNFNQVSEDVYVYEAKLLVT